MSIIKEDVPEELLFDGKDGAPVKAEDLEYTLNVIATSEGIEG